jgi:hypothetical protein
VLPVQWVFFCVLFLVSCCVHIENRVFDDRVVVTSVLALFTEFIDRPKCNQFIKSKQN